MPPSRATRSRSAVRGDPRSRPHGPLHEGRSSMVDVVESPGAARALLEPPDRGPFRPAPKHRKERAVAPPPKEWRGSVEPRRARRRPGPPPPSRDRRSDPSSMDGPPPRCRSRKAARPGRARSSRSQRSRAATHHRSGASCACPCSSRSSWASTGPPKRPAEDRYPRTRDLPRRGALERAGLLEPPRRALPGCPPKRASWLLPERSVLDAPEGASRSMVTLRRGGHDRPSLASIVVVGTPRRRAATTWRESCRACCIVPVASEPFLEHGHLPRGAPRRERHRPVLARRFAEAR